MSETIDSLDIQIKASATKADDAIDKLVGKLEKLSASLGSLNTAGLGNLAKGVNELSGAMQSMKNIGTADFTRLAKNITKMGEIDSASIGRAASSLNRFANSLGTLDSVNVSDNVSQIGQLANGIKQLGYKSSTQAIANIPKLATAMRQLMTELSKAPKVSQNLIQMTEALARLSRTGSSSGRAASSLGKALDSYTVSTNRAKNGTFSLASAIGKLYAGYWLLFRAFRKIGEAIDISSDLTEVQNVVDVTFGDMAYKVEDFAKTSIEQFGMSELSLKQYASRFQAMGSAMGIDKSLISNANSFLTDQTNGYIGLSDSMSDVSLNLTKLTADMASFYNMEQSDVAEDLEAIFTGMTRPLRTYGLDLTEATLKEWAMKNGLDANIDSMTQAEKTMLRYQYVMANTGAAQGDFARTANTWANQVRILKQNFQQLASVIGGVFINALKPLVSALNAAMSHIIAFAETISNALGKIFGWKYENSGGGVANDIEDIGDEADSATNSINDIQKALKELKNATLGIDELNIISPMDDSSGSGSGNGVSGSSGGLASGQWVQQESIFDSFKSDIDSLYELGEYIGKTLTDAMNSIDWDSVYKSARNFGKGLADFLNGLISPELFGATGKTIASALNTAIYAALSFGETFEWDELGESISAGINEFFRTFDFESLAKMLNTWVDGLEETIGTAIRNLDYSEILNGLYDFFSNLEFDTVAVIIGTLTVKKIGKVVIWKAIKELIGSKLSSALAGLGIGTVSISQLVIGFASIFPKFQGSAGFDVVADWVITGIEDAMDKLLPDWINKFIGKFVLGFSTAGVLSGGNPFAAAIGALFTTFPIEVNWFGEGGVFSFEWTTEWFKEAKRAFQTAFDGNRTDLMDIGGWILEGILDGFVGAITFVFEPIARFFNEIVNGIKEVFGIASPAKEMKPLGEYILLGIVEGFSNKVSEFNTAISTWFNESVSPWFTVDKWQGLGENIKTGISTKWNEFTSWWRNTGFYNWWNNEVAPWFTKEKWGVFGSNVKTALSTKWNEFTSWWRNTGIYGWWTNDVSPWFTREKWISVSSGMKIGIQEKWNEFTSWWKSTGFYSWWNNDVKPHFTKDQWTWSGISEGMKAAWENAISGIKVIWNRFASWLNEKLTFSWDGINIDGKEIIAAGKINLGKIPTFESGGYPNTGELFMARENGITEMVGSIGNHAAVANNDQIVEGIAYGVEAAVSSVLEPYLRQIAQNTRETADKDMSVKIQDRDIVESYRRGSARMGHNFQLV